jgi:uncharacterized damage-inducible protein DinB
MTADEARTHIQYSSWASKRLLDAAQTLDSEQLHRDLGVPNKSLHGTFAHILMADRVWLARVSGRVLTNPTEQTEAIEAEWPRVLEQWEAWAKTLTDTDLTQAIAYKNLKGNPYVTPLWQIVMHVVNHSTMHRGQAMAMFRQIGLAPPETDLIVYYRDQKSAPA